MEQADIQSIQALIPDGFFQYCFTDDEVQVLHENFVLFKKSFDLGQLQQCGNSYFCVSSFYLMLTDSKSCKLFIFNKNNLFISPVIPEQSFFGSEDISTFGSDGRYLFAITLQNRLVRINPVDLSVTVFNNICNVCRIESFNRSVLICCQVAQGRYIWVNQENQPIPQLSGCFKYQQFGIFKAASGQHKANCLFMIDTHPIVLEELATANDNSLSGTFTLEIFGKSHFQKHSATIRTHYLSSYAKIDQNCNLDAQFLLNFSQKFRHISVLEPAAAEEYVAALRSLGTVNSQMFLGYVMNHFAAVAQMDRGKLIQSIVLENHVFKSQVVKLQNELVKLQRIRGQELTEFAGLRNKFDERIVQIQELEKQILGVLKQLKTTK